MRPDVTGLIILAVCVVFFLTKWLPASVTGMAGCMAMVLFKVCTFEQAFSGFSSSIVLLMAGAMIVGISLFKTGAAQIIGHAAIRLSKNSEHRFLMFCCVIGGLLSMFLANTALVAAFIPVIESAARAEGSSMSRMDLVLPVTLAIMIGGAGTLVGCTPQLTANALMTALAGQEMTLWTLTAPTMCIFVLFLLYMHFFGISSAKKVWGDRAERAIAVDPEKLKAIEKPVTDRKKTLAMTAILVLMIAFYVTGVIPPAHTAIIAAIACIASGCCTTADIKRELNGETIVFLATCLGLAEALTASGSGELVGHAVSALLGSVHSPFLAFAVIVLLTLVLSQFITNSTAIIIALPIGLSLCSVYGMNPMTFCVGVTLAASVACCTPLAAAQITMTQVAGYEFGDYTRYCTLPSLVMYVGILIFVPLFYPL